MRGTTLSITKAVIPAAGLGTRLLPITKEMPKEMLPIFTRGKDNQIFVKPMLQAVFEQLYDSNFREFCFVIGRGKRTIEDHFTPDWGFVEYLLSKSKTKEVNELKAFYKKIQDSILMFVNQPQPKGFGDAVLKAKAFTGEETFLVHAGDDLILSERTTYIKRLVDTFQTLEADAAFLVEKVSNPSKYGVIKGEQIEEYLYRVSKIVEKPHIPTSNVAAIAVYVFKPEIYRQLERVAPDKAGEIQLTGAIQRLIEERDAVFAVELQEGENRIDIGTTADYWTALDITYGLTAY
jgi:UTP--glucose-1-phosphate uridylyltransferase